MTDKQRGVSHITHKKSRQVARGANAAMLKWIEHNVPGASVCLVSRKWLLEGANLVQAGEITLEEFCAEILGLPVEKICRNGQFFLDPDNDVPF